MEEEEEEDQTDQQHNINPEAHVSYDSKGSKVFAKFNEKNTAQESATCSRENPPDFCHGLIMNSHDLTEINDTSGNSPPRNYSNISYNVSESASLRPIAHTSAADDAQCHVVSQSSCSTLISRSDTTLVTAVHFTINALQNTDEENSQTIEISDSVASDELGESYQNQSGFAGLIADDSSTNESTSPYAPRDDESPDSELLYQDADRAELSCISAVNDQNCKCEETEIAEKEDIQSEKVRSLKINVIFKYESSPNVIIEENFVAVTPFDLKTKGEVLMQHGAVKWVVFTIYLEENTELINYIYSITHKCFPIESNLKEFQFSKLPQVGVGSKDEMITSLIYDDVHVIGDKDDETPIMHQTFEHNSVSIYVFLLIENFVCSCSHQINDDYVTWWLLTWSEVLQGRASEEAKSEILYNSLIYLYDNFDLPDENTRTMVLFKCAIFLMMTLNENGANRHLFFEIVSFKKENEKRTAEMLLNEGEGKVLLSRITDLCASLLEDINANEDATLEYAPVVLEWAEVCGMEYSLKSVRQSLIPSILRCSERFYYGSNTAENLLTLAIYARVHSTELPHYFQKMVIVSVFNVLLNLFLEEGTLKIVALDLIEHKLLDENEISLEDSTACLNIALIVLKKAIEWFNNANSKQVLDLDTIYQFLKISLDLLAINDKLSQSRWQNKIQFLKAFRTMVGELESVPKQPKITVRYISFWSDALRHREGYTEMSENFVEKQLKTDLHNKLWSLNLEVVIKLLPSVGQEIEAKNQNLHDFENFLTVFDDICIMSKIPVSLTTKTEYIFLLTHRPRVLEKFLEEVRSLLSCKLPDTPLFESVKNLLCSGHFRIFIEVLKENNALCEETASIVTKKLKETLVLLKESILSKKEVFLLQTFQSVFKEYMTVQKHIEEADDFERCLNEEIARIDVLEEKFETLNCLLVLTDQCAENGIQIQDTKMKELLNNWSTMPLKVVHESLPAHSSTGIDNEDKDCENDSELFSAILNKKRTFIKDCSRMMKSAIFQSVALRQSASMTETVDLLEFVQSTLAKIYDDVEEFGTRLISGKLTVKEFTDLANSCDNELEVETDVAFLIHRWGNNITREKRIQLIQLRMLQQKHFIKVRDGLRFAESLSRLTVLFGSTDLPELAGLSKLANFDNIQLSELTPEMIVWILDKFLPLEMDQENAVNAFTEDLSFSNWVRQKINSLQEVSFVTELLNVSSSDGEESDHLVSCFSQAIRGYAPFIFQLDPHASFEQYKRVYQRFLRNLRKDPRLPEMFRVLIGKKDYIDKVIEQSGSVEKRVARVTLEINSNGIFHVGYDAEKLQEPMSLASLSKVIWVEYDSSLQNQNNAGFEGRKLPRTFEDLKELLNELMLLVRKQEQDEAQSIKNFIDMFENVERVGSALVALYNTGCALFQKWKAVIRMANACEKTSMQLPRIEIYFEPNQRICSVFDENNGNDELSLLCIAMETIRKKWMNYVLDMRKKFHYLNYFNDRQLCLMCTGLAQNPVDDLSLYYVRKLNERIKRKDLHKFKKEYKIRHTQLTDKITAENVANEHESFLLQESVAMSAEVDRSNILVIMRNLSEQNAGNHILAKASLFATGMKSEDAASEWICDRVDNTSQNDLMYLAEQFEIRLNSQTSPFGGVSEKLEATFDEFLSTTEKNESPCVKHLNLSCLGYILGQSVELNIVKASAFISKDSNIQRAQQGKPKLMVCKNRQQIIPHLLNFFADEENQLPSYDEVLTCHSEVTPRELEVFILRAATTPLGKFYAIVFADELSLTCANELEAIIFEGKLGITSSLDNLVIFCCNESSSIAIALEKVKRRMGVIQMEPLRQFVCSKIRTKQNILGEYKALIVSSTQNSAGKSFHINQLMRKKAHIAQNRMIIRVHGKQVDFEKCLDLLWEKRKLKKPTVLHIDIASNVTANVPQFLLQLCILGGLSDARGKLFIVRKNLFIAVETTNAYQNDNCDWSSLCDLLPTSHCLSPRECLKQDERNLHIQTEDKFICANDESLKKDCFQRTCYWLTRIEENQNEVIPPYLQFDANKKSVSTCFVANSHQILTCFEQWSGLTNYSWSQMCHFSELLNEQLKMVEKNDFVAIFTGFQYFLIRHCIIKMAQDFALPSLYISDISGGQSSNQTNYDTHQVRRQWEKQPHPYIFFNADNCTFTFLGMKIKDGNLVDSKSNIIAHNVMSSDLERQIKDADYSQPNFLWENFDELSKTKQLEKLYRVLGIEELLKGTDVDPSFELTQDNVMKLLAIYMRFKCNIPVIIIGETGCGKTRLIEYLCLLLAANKKVQNKKIVKVHGGVTADYIARNVKDAERNAKENIKQSVETVLFFDEANTTEAIHVIKEVVCDFTIQGEPIDQTCGLKIVVACNPYKKHHPKVIEQLESAGLGYHDKVTEVEEKLDAGIPMRHLVYRVKPLPSSFLPLAWDFGQLSRDVEDTYLRQIVFTYSKTSSLNLSEDDVLFICRVLSLSQKVVRENPDLSLMISLRHVQRAMTVLEFFTQIQSFLEADPNEKELKGDAKSLKTITRLMILTVGVCYYLSMDKDRQIYRQKILEAFTGNYALPDGEKTISIELSRCQEIFLRHIKLDPTIAKNQALSENVFMMIVCIQLKIPLFLIGKPGSSKSLAKTVVMAAMQGDNSTSRFLRRLKQTQMFSFQCSPYTRAEDIQDAFKQAAQFQKDKNLNRFTSVVVLDEIGLAEASVRMPLKILHPLLEDGYVAESENPSNVSRVAFIGISNWALDPAKMSRGILVNRTVPGFQELLESAQAICRTEDEGVGLKKLIGPLCRAYDEIYQTQSSRGPEFFGLRDFYGLLKTLYCEYLERKEGSLLWSSISKSILRNFGGRDDSSILDTFKKHCKKTVVINESSVGDELQSTKLALVRDNINSSNMRAELKIEKLKNLPESRHLLLMTENFSLLHVVTHALNLVDGEIIFGSSFPQDQEYIQVCKNVNKIKMCMEKGVTVVLMNLGCVYESLYDALNQHYIYFGEKRFVDLGLGSQRVKCAVAATFRLIVIEEEKTARAFPIPLLNRLEKHFLGTHSILNPKEVKVKNLLCQKLQNFSNLQRRDCANRYFEIRDSFVGYTIGTESCVTIEAIKKTRGGCSATDDEILQNAFEIAFQTCSFDGLIRAANTLNQTQWQKVEKLYMDQGRNNFSDFLWKQCYKMGSKQTSTPNLLEITTFSQIPSAIQIKAQNRALMVKELTMETDGRHAVLNLKLFQTEREFRQKVRDFVRKCRHSDINTLTKCLFITCSQGHRNVPLISSSKFFMKNLLEHEESVRNLHVILIVELPRNWYVSNFSSFSIGHWNTFHVDSIMEIESDPICQLIRKKTSTIKDLISFPSNERMELNQSFFTELLVECMVEYGNNSFSKKSNMDDFFQILESNYFQMAEPALRDKLAGLIERERKNDKLFVWLREKCLDLRTLIETGSPELAVLSDVRQELRKKMMKFLQAIDLDNNVRFIKSDWSKNLIIQLFHIDELHETFTFAQSRHLNLQFPFSLQICEKMKIIWDEACQNCNNQPIQDWELFLRRFEIENSEIWEVLVSLSNDPNFEHAINAFITDAININLDHKNISGPFVSFVKQTIWAEVTKTCNQEKMESFCLAYSSLQRLIPQLKEVAPIISLLSDHQLPSETKGLKNFVQRIVCENLFAKANDMDFKKETIKSLSVDVRLLEQCINGAEESTLSKQQKLSFLCQLLSSITKKLNEKTAAVSCTGIQNLWSYVRSHEHFNFGSFTFINSLATYIQNSVDAVYSRRKKSKSQYQLFLDNISETFVQIVRNFTLPHCSEEAAKNLLRLSFIYKNESRNVPLFVNSHTRNSLFLIFAINKPSLLNKSLPQIIRNEGNNIDCYQSLKSFLSTLEFLHRNSHDVDRGYSPPKFLQEFQFIIGIKSILKQFVLQISETLAQEDLTRSREIKVPVQIVSLLKQDARISKNMKHLFLQHVFYDHGSDLYMQVLSEPILHQLIPEELLNRRDEEFIDIFLIVADYQNVLMKLIKIMNGDSKKDAMKYLIQESCLVRNLAIYRYLIDSEILTRRGGTAGSVTLGHVIAQSKALGLANAIIDTNDPLSPAKRRSTDIGKDFLFLLQALSSNSTQFILAPLIDIVNGSGYESLFLPTFPDSTQKRLESIRKAKVDFTTFNECPNGHIYLIGDCGKAWKSGTCPECRSKIGGANHHLNKGNKKIGHKDEDLKVGKNEKVAGYRHDYANSISFDRQIKGLEGYIMRLFTHAALCLRNKETAMEVKMNENLDKICKSYLNLNRDDSWKFLTHVAVSCLNLPLQGSFETEDKREEWEKSFMLFIKSAHENINSVLQNYKLRSDKDSRRELNGIQGFLQARNLDTLDVPNSFEENLPLFRQFWERKFEISYSAFCQFMKVNMEEYPFLAELLEDEELLQSLKVLPQLLNFFENIKLCFEQNHLQASRSFKDFIQNANLPFPRIKQLEHGADIFLKVWNERIRKRVIISTSSIPCKFDKILCKDSSIKYFLPTRHVNDCCALVTMHFLVSKQNELIEKYRHCCQIETKAWYLNENDMVTEEHMITVNDLQSELFPLMLYFTIRDTETKASPTTYDFPKIQEAVADQLCSSKPMIKLEVIPRVSLNESTEKALNNARASIKIEILSSGEKIKLKTQFTRIADVCQMLQQVELLMKYIDPVGNGCSDETDLGEFMKQRLRMQISPNLRNFKMTQLVSLWQHLALQKTQLMIGHGGEDPYPFILPEFREKLEPGQVLELKHVNANEKDTLLLLLNELILIKLHKPDLMRPNYHIETDCLDYYYDEETNLNLPPWAELRFAEDVMKTLADAK